MKKELVVNLNIYPNSIDQTDPETQRNIYIQGNQGQYNTNQQNIDLPPVQPYHLSFQNIDITYEKPSKSQQNQENHSNQNTLLFPAQTNSTQTETNYTPPNEEEFIKAKSVNNIEIQQYTNFSEIRQKGIYHPNENTFNISIGCYKCIPFFVCFIAIRTFINSLTNLQFVKYQNYHTILNVF